MAGTHLHTDHHFDSAIKHGIALEEHLRSNPCVECMSKHAYALENYLEEEVATNPNANPRLLQLANKVRDVRRELMEMHGIKHSHSVEKAEQTI